MPHLSGHHGSVAINVKDDKLYAWDPETRALVEQLPERTREQTIERCYEQARECFWEDAGELAREHGYSGTVYSEGRMGGWLKLADRLDWLDATDRDFNIEPIPHDAEEWESDQYDEAVSERAQFMRFADAIGELIDSAREDFAERLREEVAEVDARRETCLVRGEN